MKAEPSSLISATMQERDLIPCFVAELRRLGCQDSELDEIEARSEADVNDRYFHSEVAYYDLKYLFNELNKYAPDGHYFGAHPGDGADYGFWPCENE